VRKLKPVESLSAKATEPLKANLVLMNEMVPCDNSQVLLALLR
jgi:hypothetical protein